MLATALSLLILGHQTPDMDLIMHPKLPIGAYVLPQLGGQREVVMGPLLHEPEYYGFYAQYGASFNNLGNMHIQNPDFYEDERVGYMSWSVANYPKDGKPAILLQTEGDYKQAMKLIKKRYLQFDNRAKISYWISPQGKLLEEDSIITVSAGRWVMQATFNADSYDLYLNDPVRGERRNTVNPGCGVEKLDAMFTPMIKEGKELMQEKEFYALDPLTGAPIKYTAKLGGRWDGKLFKSKYSGKYVDIEGGKGPERIYLSDTGVLFRVDTPEHHYLGIEQKPDSTSGDTHKIGG